MYTFISLSVYIYTLFVISLFYYYIFISVNGFLAIGCDLDFYLLIYLFIF